MSRRALLEVIVMTDRKMLGTREFPAGQVIIGTAPTATLRLVDPQVSPHHASINFTGRSCLLEDLDSSTGTWLKGARVSNHLLRPADEIRIGKFRLRFVVHRKDSEAALPAVSEAITDTDETAADNDATHVGALPAGDAAPASNISQEVEAMFEQMVATDVATKRPVEAPPPASPASSAPAGRRPEFAGQANAAEITSVDRLPGIPPPGERPMPRQPAAREEPARIAPPPVEHPRAGGGAALAVEVAREVQPAPAVIVRPAPRIEPERAPAPVPAAMAAVAQPGSAVPGRRPEPDVDDDEDDHFEPRFSLPEVLVGRRGTAQEMPEGRALLAEVVTFRDRRVSGIHHLPKGRKLMVPNTRQLLCRRKRPREIWVMMANASEPRIWQDGRALGADEISPLINRSGVVKLVPGQEMAVRLNPREQAYVKFVPQVAPPPRTRISLMPTREGLATAGSSFALHIVVFTAISIWGLSRETEAADLGARYATIAVKDLELEPPPPPPPPEPEPPKEEPKPEAQPTAVAPTVAPRHQTHSRHAMPMVSGQPPTQTSKMMTALGSVLAPTKAVAMTNLDAVGVSHAAGGFKVSGAIGKLPGDQLHLAAAGSGVGRVDTKTATQLMAGNVGRVTGSSSGKVRALVTSPPARTVEVQGELDRSEVLKVVNAHLREIQHCYERQLIQQPSLSGRILFEWVIGTTGSVGVVRVKFSDLHSTEVATCIQSAIKEWRFPEPRGGSVTVSYPFVFSTVGS